MRGAGWRAGQRGWAQAKLLSLLQRRPRPGRGPGGGVPAVEEQDARSAGTSSPQPLCRAATPRPGAVRPVAVPEAVGGGAAAAVGGGERRGEETRGQRV